MNENAGHKDRPEKLQAFQCCLIFEANTRDIIFGIVENLCSANFAELP
ncbi:MAG: hypothetical protein QM527_03195 [Alphaproteobacteria bacterium]|nr:hypothetical protein [Alphaproteobacteria bacterium]